MCGRFYIDETTAKAIDRIVRRVGNQLHQAHYAGDIFPTGKSTIIRGKQHTPIAEHMAWGFSGREKKGGLINARAETILSRPTFRDSILLRRCIIPSAHFYEWTPAKEKVSFERPDTPTLLMAGIYDTTPDLPHFVIITTGANASMAPYHPRMPLILDESEVDEWLFDDSATKAFLHKTPPQLRAYQPYAQQSLF